MPVVDDSINLPSGSALWTGSLTPGSPALNFVLADAAVANVAGVGSITNTGDGASGPWSIGAIAGLTITPSSGSSIAAGASVALSFTAAAAGSYAPVLFCDGAAITGNPQTIAVNPPPSIVLSSSGNALTGVEYSVTVTAANLTGPLVVTPVNVTPTSGAGAATFNPTTATPAPGELVKLFGATWATTGAKQIRATAPGGIVSNTLPVTVVLAPPATATLSGSSSVQTGATHTSTVTLSSVADQTYTITWSRSNGGTGPATSTIAAGQTTASTTSTWAAAGAGRTVDFTISPSITRAGRPLSVTVSAPPPPAPAPPPTSTPQPFTLTSATSGVLVFALGFPCRQGDVPAGRSLSFTNATAKFTALSTWPDGSARFGIIAGTYTSAGSAVTVTPTVATVAAGTLLTGAAVQTAMGANTAAFNCGAFGTVTLSGSDFASPFHIHAATDGFIEAIYRKPVGADAHLVAWLALRVWSGGQVEALPWIENGYLQVASPTNKSETYTFTLGGTSRFSAAINLLNHQRTPLVSGTITSHWLGTDPGVIVAHDKAYLQATALIPTYSATTSTGSSVVTSQPSTFTPLQQGSYPVGMGAAGYHGSIGVLPQWDALYITTTASMWKVVQWQAYSAGRYGIHFRDETTNRPARLSSYPNLVLNGSSGIAATGSSSIGTETPTATGGSPPSFYTSHHPSMGFMAYLLTGWMYHLETAQFVVVANGFKQTDITRGFTQGVLKPNAGANTTRGAGWAIRSLAQVAAISPDGDTMHTEFVAQMGHNITYFHGRYVAQPNNPLGWVTPYSDYSTATYSGTTQTGSTATAVVLPSGASAVDGTYVGEYLSIGKHGASTAGQRRLITGYVGSTRTATVSSAFTFESGNTMPARDFVIDDGQLREAWWMQDFVTAAFGYAVALKPAVTQQLMDKLRGFFQWKARSIVDRFGDAQTHNFLYRDAAQYEGPVAPCALPDFETGRGPWYANPGAQWDEVWTVSNPAPTRAAGDLRGGNYPSASSYWANLMPAFAYAVEQGIVGAIEGWRRMTGASNWSSFETNLNDSPEWAHAPLGGTAIPSWASAGAAWEWVEIPDTMLSATPPTVASAGNAEKKITAWCGAALKRRGSVYMLGAAGGHTDYAGNEVNTLNAGASSPDWAEVRASTPFASLYSNSPYYADNRPAAAHTYHATHYVYSLNAMVVFMRTGISSGFPGVSDPPGGWPYANSDGWSKVFSFDTNDWVLGNASYLPVPYNTAFAALSGVNTDTALGYSDPKNGDYYMSGSAGGGWWRWNASTQTWGTTGGGNRSPWYAGAAVDWTRSQLWVVGGFAASAPLLMNYAGTVDISVTYTGDGIGSLTFAGGYPAAVYDSKNDTFLAFFQNGTGAIQCRRVLRSTSAVSTPTMTGSVPGDRTNGIHNSVQYAPELEGVIALPSYTQNARFMKTA